MKAILLTTALVLTATTQAKEEKPVIYECSNSQFKVTVSGSQIFEDEYGISDREFITSIFDNDIEVKVEEGSLSETYKIVASIADGAGQDSFQAFSRANSSLTPLELKTDFYFEHEGGCLEGSIYSLKTNKWIQIDGCWDNDATERMMCNFYF